VSNEHKTKSSPTNQLQKDIMQWIFLKKFSKEAPFSHNLVYLNSLVELGTSDSHLKLIAELTTFYIEGRYPAYKKKLSAMINKEKSSSILKRTEELFKWLKSKLR